MIIGLIGSILMIAAIVRLIGFAVSVFFSVGGAVIVMFSMLWNMVNPTVAIIATVLGLFALAASKVAHYAVAVLWGILLGFFPFGLLLGLGAHWFFALLAGAVCLGTVVAKADAFHAIE